MVSEQFQAVVKSRISEHQAAEQRRAEELAEKAREKIRAEEAAKLRQQQEQEATAQRQREEEAARVERERLAAQTPTATPAPPAATVTPTPAPTSAPAPATVHQLPARTAAPAVPAGPPTLSIGALNERIAPLRTDAAGLITLGFPPTQVGGGKYLHEHDYGHILAAMVQHLEALQAKQAA